MWKWILIAAVSALALWLIWPLLFPQEQPSSVIQPVSGELGSGYGYTDAAGNQVEAYGANTIQVTGSATILPMPTLSGNFAGPRG